MFNRRAACLVDLQWTANKRSTNRIHLSFSAWSSPGLFPLQMQSVSLYTVCNSTMYCNCRPRFAKSQHEFSFFDLRRHFNNCERSASSGRIWKLKWHDQHHITYSNAFSCHFPTIRLMSNVTLKKAHISTVHLYINIK